MTIEEEIQKYADELAQEYFPNEHNIWARENLEAQFVAEACMRMAYIVAKHVEQKLIEKAYEWLEEKLLCAEDYYPTIEFLPIIEYDSLKEFINDFRKAMEE